MTLQQLEYIVALFHTRHFAKAAESCCVTQPTLSAMLQKLESELGVRLFERSSQQVSATAIGEKVVAQAMKVLSEAQHVRDIVSEEAFTLSGTFRLGVLPTIAPYLLPRFFPTLCHNYPDLDLRVTELKTADMKKALQQGVIDAAIMVDFEELHAFEQTSLYYEQFLAYVSREDKLFENRNIKTSDLDHQSLWLLDEGHCFRDQLVKFCNLKAAQTSKTTYTLGSIETFMRIVEGGEGITFIPELALDQLTSEQKELVRPFALPIPTRQIVFLTLPSFVRYAVRDLLVSAIQSHVPARMLKLNNTEQRI